MQSEDKQRAWAAAHGNFLGLCGHRRCVTAFILTITLPETLYPGSRGGDSRGCHSIVPTVLTDSAGLKVTGIPTAQCGHDCHSEDGH